MRSGAPRFLPKSPLVSLIPTSSLSLVQSPFSDSAGCRSQLTSLNFLPIQKLSPRNSRFLSRSPMPLNEWFLYLSGPSTCSWQECWSASSYCIPPGSRKPFHIWRIVVVGILCWQLFSLGLWIYHSGFCDFCREVGSESAVKFYSCSLMVIVPFVLLLCWRLFSALVLSFQWS